MSELKAPTPLSPTYSVAKFQVQGSVEQVGGAPRRVPFAERDGAVPAFIHGLFEMLEHFGSVLRFVALERTLKSFFILLGVRDVDG